jgi:hypothetical protein
MTCYEPRPGCRRFFDTKCEGLHTQVAECRQLVDRWHEESKRRYEELACQSLELAEQRQRCA